jgi:hypothetical protein
VSFEVLTVVKTSLLLAFKAGTPYRVVGSWKQYVSPKLWHVFSSPHGVTVQKTNVDVIPSV